MSELDPFADQAFVSRLQKLLSMLGSAQPAEAEAARLKLVDHLGQHRLSLTDVSMRVGAAPRPAPFLGGQREATLERQLWAAQQARAEAEAEAARARARVANLEIELRSTGFARVLAGLLLLVTLGLGGIVTWRALTIRHEPPTKTATIDNGEHAPAADAPPLRVAAGEHLGQAAVQDLPLRLQPNEDADVRAFLNMGERLIIERRIQTGGQTWFYVRSQSATGYVRAGDVLHH